MRSRRKKRGQKMVEMQMGPMIDMVFLLLVFFMVSAKPVTPESDIPIGLPGQVAQEEVVDIPDDIRIQIQEDGQAVLNEQALDSPNARAMPELVAVLKRLKEASENARSEILVTISPHDAVPHQRLIDVLNACAEAEITGVTFGGNGE
jgi:biopolymer transport protein ExbD